MQRKLLSGTIVVILAFIVSCSNPFLQKKEPVPAAPEVPRITEHPRNAAYSVGAQPQAMKVAAQVSDNGELSYRWYRVMEEGAEDGIAISGAREASYYPPTGSVGTAYYYAEVTNTLNGQTAVALSNTAKVAVNAAVYTVKLAISGDEGNDLVSFDEDDTVLETSGCAGEELTLYYTVDDIVYYNRLSFEGVALAPVGSAGSGETSYTVDADDVVDGGITITAVFEHIDLLPDPIAFETPEQVTVTYGDAPFTNAVTDGYEGDGEITYSSDDETVAVVDANTGEVTILSAGTAIITAEKAADDVYAGASISYTLTVNKRDISNALVSVGGTYTYNGSPHTPTPDVSDSGLIAASDWAVLSYSGNTNAGTAVVTVTATAEGNYAGTQTANFTIDKADIDAPVDMVRIPAGTFLMGSPDGTGGINGDVTEPNRSTNETLHWVTLTEGFYMGKYQVTQAQWVAVMGASADRTTTTYGKGNDYPVYYVSWYDAIVFCNRLSMMEGLTPAYRIPYYNSTDPDDWGTIPTSSNTNWNNVEIVAGSTGYRLPTEAQWEYACRAGTATAFNWGTNQITTDQANFDGSSNLYNGSPAGVYLGRTAEVGSYAPNAWGLYDMHGNVLEWCWDWYGSYSSGAQTDPTGAASGASRVIRGGSWYGYGQNLRSACRDYYGPYYRYSGHGFRLLRP